MKEVASGTNDALLEKARKSKKVIFEQKLSNGSTLLGVKLAKRTSKAVDSAFRVELGSADKATTGAFTIPISGVVPISISHNTQIY